MVPGVSLRCAWHPWRLLLSGCPAPVFLDRLRQPLAGQDRRSYCDILVAGIQDAISNRTLKPGDLLPSERDLIAAPDISRNAIHRAIATAEADGILLTPPTQSLASPRR